MAPVGMRITAVVAALIATAVLAACGDSSQPASDAQPTEHNAADVTFAQKMIPHHQQALDMAAMVPSRTTNEKLVVMAKHIALDQQAQIDTLQGLLQQWGEPAAADHMGHDGMGMDGMVDAATMEKLPTLKGAEFDNLWLESMISHHQGAVAMAEPEVAQGKNPTAVKMAKIIVQWQQFEIGQMHAMLGPSE
jgi:uncharacterized protein (DUF305 family)